MWPTTSPAVGPPTPRFPEAETPGPAVCLPLPSPGKPHLCAIKDLHSGRIVGYSMDARMTAALAVTALRNAIAFGRGAWRLLE